MFNKNIGGDQEDWEDGVDTNGEDISIDWGGIFGNAVMSKSLETVKSRNKFRDIAKRVSKNKGKGILLEKRNKPLVNVLKPVNKMGTSSSSPSKIPFDDGSRMGPIVLGEKV